MEDEIQLYKALEQLKLKHQELDDLIDRMSHSGSVSVNELELRRLKNQRLALKDQIFRVEEQIYPDIIA